jgi:transcriptional regulator with XRE-family HTH domain
MTAHPDDRRKKRILARFGARVRELRRGRGWTQAELAQKTGRQRTYIGDVERGERNITLLVIEDIARALGVPARDLFTSSQKEKDE